MSRNGFSFVRCAAKINLYLGVVEKRSDGYHDIETVFQPVSLFDEITFERADEGIELCGSGNNICWDRTNLCYRAAEELFEYVGSSPGVRINVIKNIPVGAGLGGGSSDAGAVIMGLNEYFDFGLTRKELMEIALKIGSDVPFFVFGRPAVGRGRGELLEGIDGLEECFILLVLTGIRISTKKAFKNISLLLTRSDSRYRLNRLLKGLDEFPESEIETYNSFEVQIEENYPDIGKVLTILEKREDCVFSSLSGSGSACFAVFNDRTSAERTLDYLSVKGFLGSIVEPLNKTVYFEGKGKLKGGKWKSPK